MAHNIPGQLSYLDSCRTWTVVAPGQLSYLDSCRTWTVVTWTVVAWTVVAWTDVGASFLTFMDPRAGRGIPASKKNNENKSKIVSV